MEIVVYESMWSRSGSVFADHERERTMRIDVIGTVLRVVFENEDGGVFPVGTVRDRLDDAAEGEIVIGNVGGRSRAPGPCASGVVVGQMHRDELREFPLFALPASSDEAIELREKLVGAQLVG